MLRCITKPFHPVHARWVVMNQNEWSLSLKILDWKRDETGDRLQILCCKIIQYDQLAADLYYVP